MQSCSGLIKNKEDVIPGFGASFSQEGSQLDPLCFSARQRVGALPHTDIAQAYFLQGLQAIDDLGFAGKKVNGLVDGHV